ncbi:MAG: methionyl-tRNA formyltransferase [Clostridia bacterium]|nr:methionyl-tRNA formyltransferase [Clostridia bacterium]
MKIVFMGTPDFSVPCLEGLLEDGHEVALVVTQADKPKGRGHKLTPPPVKVCALAHNIPVYQPEKMKDDETFNVLKDVNADVFVVVAFGKILPERILNLPTYGCINVHASLLPKYRGAAPMQHCIMDGERKTGVTTMQMDVGLDTGDMLIKKEIDITVKDTTESIHDKLSILGKEALSETLNAIQNGTLTPKKQKDELACYATMITKETAKIDFTRSADEIARLVRAMYSYPMAQTTYEGKLMKIISAKALKGDFIGETGTILSVKNGFLVVKCGEDALLIDEIQMEGKKRMSVAEYVKGNSFTIGEKLI